MRKKIATAQSYLLLPKIWKIKRDGEHKILRNKDTDIVLKYCALMATDSMRFVKGLKKKRDGDKNRSRKMVT